MSKLHPHLVIVLHIALALNLAMYNYSYLDTIMQNTLLFHPGLLK